MSARPVLAVGHAQLTISTIEIMRARQEGECHHAKQERDDEGKIELVRTEEDDEQDIGQLEKCCALP